MPVIAANSEPVKIAGPGDAWREYNFQLEGNALLIGRTKSNAKDPFGPGQRIRKGDRGTLEREEGEELWAYNDDLADTGDDADLTIDRSGFFISFGSRPVVGAVQRDSGEEAPAASDAFIHRHATGADASSTVTETFSPPDRADLLTIHTDDANGSFGVTVKFLDPDDDSVITERTQAENSGLSGSSTTQVYERVAIASPRVEVEFSGSATSVDYTVYAR